MKAKEFVEGKLKELASKFKEVIIRYEYRANTQSHLVEVVPLSFFEGNEAYLIEEAKLENEFETIFPMENIVFISEGSLTEIKKIDLEIGPRIITFDYIKSTIEFEVEGYSEAVEPQECENYALAA